jgi:hypothetical protein
MCITCRFILLRGSVWAGPLVALGLLLPTAGHAVSMLSFVHRATAGNISGSLTEIDHPLLNDRPDARVFVTQAWNLALGQGTANPRAVAPRYDVDFSGQGRWSIFNQDFTAMAIGLTFHVMVTDRTAPSFIHLTHEDNTSGIGSTVACPPEHETTCFGATPELLHAHTLDAWGFRGARFLVPTSMLYSSPSLFLRAESNSFSDMILGALFWVLVGDELADGAWTFGHTASAATISFRTSRLDDPRLNAKPGALLFVSRAGPSGPALEEHIGVFYSTEDNRWKVFHQGPTPMAPGERFVILVPPLFVDGFESGDLSWWD